MKNEHDALREIIREAIRGRGVDSQMSPEAFEALIQSRIEDRFTHTVIIAGRENTGLFVELSINGKGTIAINRNHGMQILLVDEKYASDVN